MAKMPVGIEVKGKIKDKLFIEVGYQLGQAIEECCRLAHNSSIPFMMEIKKDDVTITIKVN